MKNKPCSVIFLFLLLFCHSALFADQITIAADPWMPYTGAGKPAEGYLIDIARKVFRRHGHTVVYKVVPWSAALRNTRSGVFQGAAGAYKTDAPDFVFPENELGVSIHKCYVRKGDPWRFKGLSSLGGRRLGAISDYSYGDSLDGYIRDNRTNPKRIFLSNGDNALPLLIKMLLDKRIDEIIENSMVMDHGISEFKAWDKLQDAGTDGIAYNVYIGFSPKNPRSKRYAKLLSDGIADLRKTGELNDILRKYGLVDWR
jgi:polar amino acid transport system substrate-binding protein